uniref:Putative conserved secreted protein n=1 Tax=Rhipicephalus microplus TaxID=6941 RepID=A0A6M2CKR9_RHIMP
MSCPTLTFLLIFVLACLQVFGAVKNANTTDPLKKTTMICKPRPHGDTLGARSTCPFTVTEDNDFRRVPVIIYHFNCDCPSSRCSDDESYRCVQVRKPLQVLLAVFNTKKTLFQKKVIQYNASCVCAVPVSKKPFLLHRLGAESLDKNSDQKVPQLDEGVIKIHANESVEQF